jgi:hypothetical protein
MLLSLPAVDFFLSWLLSPSGKSLSLGPMLRNFTVVIYECSQ